jgi:hypothetical protein
MLGGRCRTIGTQERKFHVVDQIMINAILNLLASAKHHVGRSNPE